MNGARLARVWPAARTRIVVAAAVLAAGAAGCARGRRCPADSKPAPLDYSLDDLNGARVELASFRGRPLIVNFWATWCGPCKKEIPALVALVDKYRTRRLAVVGISIDDAPASARTYAAAHRMNYPVLIGRGHDALLKAYQAQFGIPVSWFVTAQGCVADTHLGMMTADQFDRQARALF